MKFLFFKVKEYYPNYSSHDPYFQATMWSDDGQPDLHKVCSSIFGEHYAGSAELPTENRTHEGMIAYLKDSFPEVQFDWKLVIGYQVFVEADEDTAWGRTFAVLRDATNNWYKLTAGYNGYWYRYKESAEGERIVRWPREAVAELVSIPPDYLSSEEWRNSLDDFELDASIRSTVPLRQALQRFLEQQHPEFL